MTYIGATPTTGDFKLLDSITTSSTTTFNLRQGGVAVYPQSANHCLVVLNGVLQTAGSSFNIVNDTIVFASSLSSSDVINQILVLGNVNDIGVPSDSTVTDAKIVDMAASKLTGTVAQANIADQAINEAKMQISNAPTNGYMLTAQSGNTGGLTWAEAPSGNLVQTGSLYSYSNGTTSVSINDCFETDYDMYLVMFNILPANNAVSFRMRLMDGGTNIEASKHHYVSRYYDADGNGSDNRSETQSYFQLADSVSSREYDGGLVASLTCFLDRNQTSSCAFKYTGNSFFTQSNSSARVHNTYVSGQLDDTETNENVTGIKLFFGSGNIENVNLQVYGLKGSAS